MMRVLVIFIEAHVSNRLRMMPNTAATSRRFIRPPTLSGVWEVCARG